MQPSQFSRFLFIVVAAALLLSTVSDAGRGHYRHRHGHRRHRRRNRQTRVVIDGLAGTGVVFSHERRHRPHSHGVHVYRPPIIVQDVCERISCYDDNHCTYNGCGGYRCSSCDTCDGKTLGKCVRNLPPRERRCPPVYCPYLPNVLTPISSPENQDAKSGGHEKNKTESKASTPASTPHHGKATLPWDAAFDDLKAASSNNNTNTTTQPAKRETTPP